MAVLLLGGTTASGKSALAVELAVEHGAAIVSADAMTIYRGLSVGTAKPTIAERKGVPHFGIDIRDPDEAFDVAEFVDMVGEVVAAHPHTIVVGGTTFWLSALVRPLADLPPASVEVRERLAQLADPHDALARIDPEAARRLHPNDRVRIVRALEVHAITGRTQTAIHRDGARGPALNAAVAWMDRDDVYDRINARTSAMVESGYIEEVREALRRGYGNSKPLKSFAYRHIAEHVSGGLPREEAIRRTARDTRHYAKKQRTWARNLGWETQSKDEIVTLYRSLMTDGPG